MIKVVELSFKYALDAERVWEISSDWRALEYVTSGMVSFRGLPRRQMATGDMLDVEVSMFGLLPWTPYRIEMILVDHAARMYLSEEHGNGVKTWSHRHSVTPTGTGCTVTDRIEIDAGRLTFFAAWWARIMYQRRHPARMRLLELD